MGRHHNPIDDGYRCIYMMLIYESHVFQLRVETKLQVYDPGSFFDATYEVTRKA